jgi:hypothetical protein
MGHEQITPTTPVSQSIPSAFFVPCFLFPRLSVPQSLSPSVPRSPHPSVPQSLSPWSPPFSLFAPPCFSYPHPSPPKTAPFVHSNQLSSKRFLSPSTKQTTYDLPAIGKQPFAVGNT